MIQPEQRLLVLTPTGRDAELARSVLVRHGVPSEEVAMESLRDQLDAGVGALLIAEEAIGNGAGPVLEQVISSQPAWSDIPILLFADAERSEVYLRTLRLLEGLRNVVLLERPIRLGAALSLIRSSLVDCWQWTAGAQIIEHATRTGISADDLTTQGP